MSLNRLLKSSFQSLKITVKQEKPTKLPYYGAIARGWLGDALYPHKELWKLLFKNPYVDVRPYFLYTTHFNRTIVITINLLGFSSRLTKDLVDALSSKVEGHFGGLSSRIENIYYFEDNFEYLNLNKEFKITFSTPVSITTNERMHIAPSLNDIVKSLVRSANKFCKYYMKKCYPLHIKETTREVTAEILGFNLKPYHWNHRNKKGNVIPLKGVCGDVEYRVNKVTKELGEILTLTRVFQIGKWTSYGFGKLEVI